MWLPPKDASRRHDGLLWFQIASNTLSAHDDSPSNSVELAPASSPGFLHILSAQPSLSHRYHLAFHGQIILYINMYSNIASIVVHLYTSNPIETVLSTAHCTFINIPHAGIFKYLLL